MDWKERIGSKNSKCQFFWNARGIVSIDFLQKLKAINGEYYANLLQSCLVLRVITMAKINKRFASSRSLFARFSPLKLFSFAKLQRWRGVCCPWSDSTVFTSIEASEHSWKKRIELKGNKDVSRNFFRFPVVGLPSRISFVFREFARNVCCAFWSQLPSGIANRGESGRESNAVSWWLKAAILIYAPLLASSASASGVPVRYWRRSQSITGSKGSHATP